MHADVAFAILLGIVAFEVVVWAFATRAAWRAIRNTIALAGFGVGATLAFLVVATSVQDTRIITGLFLTLCVLSFLVAEKLRQ
jgi:hypothetical protein